MDIVGEFTKRQYESLIEGVQDYYHNRYFFLIVESMPKKTKEKDKIYFCCDSKIVGYGIVNFICPIDDELMAESIGGIWEHVGKVMIRWRSNNWYDRQYKYNKSLKKNRWKYINFKRWLAGREEPQLIDVEKIREK